MTKEIKRKAIRYSFLTTGLVKKRKRIINSSRQHRGEAGEECQQGVLPPRQPGCAAQPGRALAASEATYPKKQPEIRFETFVGDLREPVRSVQYGGKIGQESDVGCPRWLEWTIMKIL